jgi:hypothetical protein
MKMNTATIVTALAVLSGVIGTVTTSARAQGVISKEVASAGSYCHMKFPAIRQETLSEAAPALTTSGDLIDFYGPCDHDPLGKDEVQSQKLQRQHLFTAEYED